MNKTFLVFIFLIFSISAAFAYGPCDSPLDNLQTATQCWTATSFGNSYDFLAIVIILIVVLIGFAAKLPGPLALIIGISLAYGMDIAFGRSVMLEMLIFLQLIGVIVMIFTGFFNLGRVME